MPSLFWRWIGLSGVVIVLDQISKLAVLQHFRLGDRLELTSFFNLVLAYNTGAAFSFLADAGGWQRWFFAAMALGVSVWIIWILRQHPGDKLMSVALAMIMGGALGNVIDRFIYGAVVDFLDFHAFGWHWPAFNVADSCITVGAVLMLVDQFRRKESGAAPAKVS